MGRLGVEVINQLSETMFKSDRSVHSLSSSSCLMICILPLSKATARQGQLAAM